jgi:hypothetical protein
MEAGLLTFFLVIQSQVREQKLEPVAGHRRSVNRVGIPSPQFLRNFVTELNSNFFSKKYQFLRQNLKKTDISCTLLER